MKIGQTYVTRVKEAKYLGLFLDDKVNWNEHYNTVIQKLTKIASSFKVIKHIVPNKCKKILYYAYVHSKISYGIDVYRHTTQNNINQIQVMQSKILKSLYNKDWYSPTNSLHKDLHLLQVKDIFNLSIAKLVYKQINGYLPTIFNDYFTTNREIHGIITRNADKLHTKRLRTNYGKSTLSVKGTNLYNSLPQSITNSFSLNIFTKSVKKYFLNKY